MSARRYHYEPMNLRSNPVILECSKVRTRMNGNRFHVIGAGCGMGRWFTQRLHERGQDIRCYDLDAGALSGLPKGVTACPVNKQQPYSSYKNLFQAGDTIILAVPQDALFELKGELRPCLPDRSLLVCLTSAQAEPMSKLQSWKMAVPPLGCHPLFGNTVNVPVGHVAVLTGFDEANTFHVGFSTELDSLGLMLTHLSPALHDEQMAIVQALTHLCFLAFAQSLTKLSSEPSALSDLRTPNFQFLNAFASRYLKIAPTTTGAIQSTADAKRVRALFLEECTKLVDALDTSQCIDDAAGVITNVRQWFDGAFVDEGAQTAAFAVDNAQRFEAVIHRYMSKQLPFVFRHRTSGVEHVVRITRNHPSEIEYEEATTLVDSRYAVGLDDVSRRNYAKAGLSIPKPRRARIKKKNIALLEKGELPLFWRDKVLALPLMLSVPNPCGYGRTFFEQRLPGLTKGVCDCRLIERYRKATFEKATLHMTHDARWRAEDLEREIRVLVGKHGKEKGLPTSLKTTVK